MGRQHHIYWMNQAINLANYAKNQGEMPVGAVVVKNDQFVSNGWNKSIQDNDPTAHAEIVALRKAGQVVSNYRLIEMRLYVTLEPCLMCLGALIHSRIQQIIFGASSTNSISELLSKVEVNHHVTIIGGISSINCSTLIKDFFREKRSQRKKKVKS